MGDRTRKLVALRTRTDHDLLVLVQKEINVGFALVDAAINRNSSVFAKAERALSTATALLPRITNVSMDDRKRIEERLEKLRSRLALVPVYSTPYLASAAS